ncbi:winged helix-turn-helix domain-containing protein [Algibacter sp. 2305UL17-15]|uniref:winged helix-turn-helix domain-containing protein n=1 Tax=Algibacter sp. 2305UL17-15 TaxID=3231268 RepID=UPI003459E3D2
MKQKTLLYLLAGITILGFILSSFQEHNKLDNFSKTVKVVLRNAGNKLLLANNDSTSLILPIKKLNENSYEIAFQQKLSISPDSLVEIINTSLKSANLPKRYIVEVLNCQTEEVSYSYKISFTVEKNIIPCSGRILPTDCYKINIEFLNNNPFLNSKTPYILFGIIICLLIIAFKYYNKKPKTKSSTSDTSYTKIGNYKFYETQHKLVKDTIEIQLSTKECELLNMLSEHQNEVIKRGVLIKEIWEDNGVFVGRSLDTFISKLRKKFKDDNSINIINVHGVGYKLEVN